jgi:Wax ester synthase-like Acyl-CoA acyltransferase domain/WS/DGAT C-terminal domain
VTGTSPDELSADDARILGLESEAIAGHTLKLLLLEPAEPLPIEELRELVADRVGREPRATQRVDLPEHGSPRWVEDDRFEVAAHVGARRLHGGDVEALWKLAGQIMSERLDHSRPLWALDLVGPLSDDRQAIVARIHHAMADGISCMRLLDAVLWDAVPQPPSSPRAFRSPAASQPTRRGRLGELVEMPGAIWRELANRASDSPLDRRIGAARSLAIVSVPLDDLKRIGKSLPGHVTVNDALLGVVAGGLGEWWRAGRRRLPSIRAQIPVSLHSRDDSTGEIGNRDSYLNVDLPIDEPDPIRRLEQINAETAQRKRLGDADELYDLFHALGRVPALGRIAQRVTSGPREFSLSVSNVPGPRAPITVAGRRVASLGSVAEPAQRHALRVSALSCAGSISIGLCADPEVLPGVERLAAALDDSLAELRAATIG